MNYCINVARNGHHFFATAEHSILTKQGLKIALEVFMAKFPESEGYAISATLERHTGTPIDLANIDESIEEASS